jgi:(1->4)-alpha-D-glucan 1-alpha-D-glucosylmutase
LEQLLCEFPVYRIYARIGKWSESDREYLARAVRATEAGYPESDRAVLGFLQRCLIGKPLRSAQTERPQALAMKRFQQLSAPLCAKAVEDTAFYRYGRLVSRNDVGFEPQRFADSPRDFHHHALARCEAYPRALLTTATHDHKRGEDVRARIAVLSELPQEWAQTLERLLALSAPLRITVDGAPAPRTSDLIILFQCIVGAWPPQLKLEDSAGLAFFLERIAAWQQKALREAKQASDWAAPNEAYETAACRFVARLFARPSELLPALAAFAHRIGPAGAANGLSQTLLKLTAPGVPDIYQGTEYWDTSLVDPDNRRPVDFELRRSTLHARSPAALVHEWADGRIKQALLRQVLAARRALPHLFSEGGYVPIEADGPRANHVIAFARVLGNAAAVTVISRLTADLLEEDGSLRIDRSHWGTTRLVPPPELDGSKFSDLLRNVTPPQDWHLAHVLDGLPVAFLVNGPTQEGPA